MAENAPVQYEAEELVLRGEEWGMSRGRGGVHRGVGRRTRRMAWVNQENRTSFPESACGCGGMTNRENWTCSSNGCSCMA